MGFVLKTVAVTLALTVGVQPIETQVALAAVEYPSSIQSNYQPPDNGNPDSSQSSGTR